jgi:hypothetical protein
MVLYGPALERRQAFLFRVVDIGMELFVLATTVRHVQRLAAEGFESASAAFELADLFARKTRRRVRELFRDLWQNDDERTYAAGRALLAGEYGWLESGTLPLPYEASELEPKLGRQAPANGEPKSPTRQERQPALSSH